MIGTIPGTALFISFLSTMALLSAARRWSRPVDFSYFLPLLVPISVGVIGGFSPPVIGLIAGLLIIAFSKIFSCGYKLAEYVGFLAGGLVFSLIGFRIQFIQMATSGDYVYFTWLSIPLTMTWLVLISRSVEFVHEELDRKKWRLFVVTLLFIALSFLLIVVLQQDQNLTTAFQLGLAFVGTSAGLLTFGRRKKFPPVVFRQMGFILASLALVGLLKSLTALVLLVPIAPLAIPAARGSFAFTGTLSVNQTDSSLLTKTLEKYLGSISLGIALLYVSLSYFGLASWWFIRNPGTLQAVTLALGAVLIPSSFVLTKGVVEKLRNWEPSLTETGPGSGEIFGVRFNFSRLTETSQEIGRLTRSAPTSYVATPDVTAVIQALNDKLISRAFSQADVVTPDGFGLIWASEVHDLPLEQRVAGIDLIEEVLDTESNIEVYLLGSKPGVAEKAGENLSERFEGIEITGTHHGYVSIDRQDVVSEINQLDPDLLLVGMGVPKQEDWITMHIESLNANVIMGVGGSFDVLSGNLPRAPRWMRERGLEWLYRIWLEPKRLVKARSIPYFMAKVYWEKLKSVLQDEVL